MDLTEAEHIKKRWQEYTEELYKKYIHDPHKHDGVITHLEPDIKLPTGFYKKQESSRKTSTFASLTLSKPLTVWITTSCGKLLMRWEY